MAHNRTSLRDHTIPHTKLYFQRPESSITVVRTQLDDTTFATAWAAARALTLEQAIAEALETGATTGR